MLLIQLVAVAILTLSAHYAMPPYYLQCNTSGMTFSKTKHIMVTLSILILVAGIGVVAMHWLTEQSLLSFSLLRLSFSLYITYLGCHSLVASHYNSVVNYCCNIITWLLISLGISSFGIFDPSITSRYLISTASVYIFITFIVFIFNQNKFKHKKIIHSQSLKLIASLSLFLTGSIALIKSFSILY